MQNKNSKISFFFSFYLQTNTMSQHCNQFENQTECNKKHHLSNICHKIKIKIWQHCKKSSSLCYIPLFFYLQTAFKFICRVNDSIYYYRTAKQKLYKNVFNHYFWLSFNQNARYQQKWKLLFGIKCVLCRKRCIKIPKKMRLKISNAYFNYLATQ